jgi:hypothetical protein
MSRSLAAGVAVLASLVVAAPALAQGDSLVTVGSPTGPFSQNKQNEPAVAVDQKHPDVLAAGSNDNIDMETCAAGDPTTCPFTPGIGASGIYFSLDGGDSWIQPTYTGLSARDCTGPEECTPHTGPIGTLPRYRESGLVSDGDPALAFGPRPKDGHFAWANGSRLYYANLTSNLDADAPAFRGDEAIAVSRTDHPRRAAAGSNRAWRAPVIVSKQSSTTFSDKEQVWADNAESSDYFGHVYICHASYRSRSGGNGFPEPIIVSRSADGGATWANKQVSNAGVNPNDPGRDGCTVRTDSKGTVYVFWKGVDPRTHQDGELEARSFNGGKTFEKPHLVAPAVSPGVIDAVILRPVMDGIAGARADLSAAPSVDIANGAPSGNDATDEIAMAWADGRDGLNHEKGLFTWSTNRGGSFADPVTFTPPGDRAYYAAPGISPDGTDVYVTYNAFTTPYRDDTSSPRGLVGAVTHADLGAGGAPDSFGELHRGVVGDPRSSSQNNLVAEFLGDYVYTAATRRGAVGVWNDVRRGADCPAIDVYRQEYEDAVRAGEIPPNAAPDEPAERDDITEEAPPAGEGTPPEPPNVEAECPAAFGNSDIFGAAVSDPTP